jgi:hypothetical protein
VNGRGTYGAAIGDVIPLRDRDDSPFSPSPLAVDRRGQYGGHSFHGHEASTYGGGGFRKTDFGTHWGLSWDPHLSIVGEEDRRGTYGPRVGLTLFHSPDDKRRELARLGTEIAQVKNLIWSQLGWTIAHPVLNQADPRYAWYHSVFLPTYNEFLEFRDQQLENELGPTSGAARRLVTSWDEYEAWGTRIINLKQAAETAGFAFALPVPTTPPRSIWDVGEGAASDIYGGTKKALGDVWDIAKYGLLAVLGVGGVYAVHEIIKKSKS